MKPVSRNAALTVTVAATEAGRRIDNYLASRLKDVPRSRIYRMLRSGEVRINGRRASPDQRVEESDRVRIPPLFSGGTGDAAVVPAETRRALAQAILYEDQKLLILNKPSGLAVHSGSGLPWGIIDVMRSLRPECPALQLVHRLDRDTSGCLMFAKDLRTLRDLHEQLRDRAIRKIYLALVCGEWPRQVRQIEQPLAKVRNQESEAFVAAMEEGKEAVTKVLAVERLDGFSLVRFELDTGRTHQIRVHAAGIGCPIAGDRKYGDAAANQMLRKAGCERMLLHAESLEFEHPPRLRGHTLTAPYEEIMSRTIDRIRSHAL
ncbi:MAG: RluA family pseudouridine synthase [Gammaproteobacteria bacterium]|nr:RluA family pseudouridine synthase [Gammaproteobacteria bacterium]